ncbi:MAG: non-ribosomal peptide synthetase, partial [bacterium]|nr:non-ribosomal peptide synthetase [bacterium]
KVKFGQIGYNAANEFLNAFSHYRNMPGRGFTGSTICLNWTDWRDAGMSYEAVERKTGEEAGLDALKAGLNEGLSTTEGIEVFARVMENKLTPVAVSNIDMEYLLELMEHSDKEAEQMGRNEEIQSTLLLDRPELDTVYTAPRDKTEEILVGIWEKFFGIRQLGIHDDFFELGGDSLKVMEISSKIHKELDVNIPMAEIFKKPTPAGLTEYITKAGRDKYRSIPPVEEKAFYPLSSAQKRLYLLQYLEPANKGYNMLTLFELEGKLLKERMQNTFRQLTTRHESLRTSFHMINEKPVQKIHRDIEFGVDYYDGRERRKAEDKGEDEGQGPANKFSIIYRQWLINEFFRPFDLEKAPLLRVGVITSEEDKHLLAVDMHHIISDGTSMTLIVAEFMSLYQGEELPGIRVRYRDYAEWQNRESKK